MKLKYTLIIAAALAVAVASYSNAQTQAFPAIRGNAFEPQVKATPTLAGCRTGRACLFWDGDAAGPIWKAADGTLTTLGEGGAASLPTFSSCVGGTSSGTGGAPSCTITHTGAGSARIQLTTGASGSTTGDLLVLTPSTNFSSVPVCIAQSDSGTAQNGGGYGLAFRSGTSSVSALHFESGATITNNTTYYINVVCGP